MDPTVALSNCRIIHPAGFGGGVEIVHATHAARSFPVRVSDGLGVCLKVGAAHAVVSDGRAVTFPEDSICVRFPGCVWSSELAAARFLSIDVAPELVPEDLGYQRMHFLPPAELPDIAILAARLERGADAFDRQEAVTSLIATLLPGARAIAGTRHSCVDRARDFLADHIDDDVTLADVSRAAGCDRFQLIRAFKHDLGIPPYAYFLRLRLGRAQKLLASGEHPANVAVAVGFCDQAHFTRHFKRVVGLTPGAYARQARTIARVNFIQDNARTVS